MWHKGLFNKGKISISIVLVALLILANGCEWPFSQKDTNAEAQKLKSETEKTFKTVQENSKKFDKFLKKLDKRWYTAKDMQDFSSSVNSFNSQIAADKNNLKAVQNNLASLTNLDKEKQYAAYVIATKNATSALEKSLVNSEKIVKGLSPKIGEIAKFYTAVDKVKEAQSYYISVLQLNSQRTSMGLLTKTLIEQIKKQNEAPDEDTGDDSTGDGSADSGNNDSNQETSNEPLDEFNNENIASEDVSGSDIEVEEADAKIEEKINEYKEQGAPNTATSSDSSDELEPWVYIISENEWPSAYIVDVANDSGDTFSKLHQEAYEIHKAIGFRNSRTLVKYLQEVKIDIADYASSVENVIENLKEQKRLNDLTEKYNLEIAGLNASHSANSISQRTRPSGVSAGSIANEGARATHEYIHNEIKTYNKKKAEANLEISALKAKNKGALTDDYNDAAWRFSWSILALYHKVNRKISRDLMHETKRWKRNTTSKYVYNRLQNLAEAKHQRRKANQAYREAKDKIASN